MSITRWQARLTAATEKLDGGLLMRLHDDSCRGQHKAQLVSWASVDKAIMRLTLFAPDPEPEESVQGLLPRCAAARQLVLDAAVAGSACERTRLTLFPNPWFARYVEDGEDRLQVLDASDLEPNTPVCLREARCWGRVCAGPLRRSACGRALVLLSSGDGGGKGRFFEVLIGYLIIDPVICFAARYPLDNFLVNRQ